MFNCFSKWRKPENQTSPSPPPPPDPDFFILIDFDPWKDESRQKVDWVAIETAIQRNPSVLQAQYTFRSAARGSMENYPLNRLIALGASLSLIQKACQHCPQALQNGCSSSSNLPQIINPPNTALHTACCYHAPLAVVRYLVEEGPPDLVQQRTKHACTPLHLACERQQTLPVIQYLVEQYPEAQWRKNKLGNTPLEDAREHNAGADVIEFLTRQQEGGGGGDLMTNEGTSQPLTATMSLGASE